MIPPPGISLTLMIGPELLLPASTLVTEAVSEISVTQNDHGPSGFSVTFNADRTSAFQTDYQMLLTRQVAIGMRVAIMVTIPGQAPRVLMDGFITNLQLSHNKESGAATITVTGEDISIKMDRTQESQQYPVLGHYEIANLILIEYALYGVIPEVIPTPTSMASDPLERTPIQDNQTDREYLNYLADQHGYVFMVRPGPLPGVNIAYWGPPLRLGVPQPALTVDMGPGTNVESINFQYDGLAPTVFHGTDQDSESEFDLPIFTMISTRLPPMALEPALLFDGGMLKTEIFDATGYEEIDAMAYAQGMTDKSVDNVVTASGEVDTLRYGAILTCPGLVGLRGCGLSFDGLYAIRSVTHTIRRGQYRQQFSLAREGLVSILPAVLP